MPATPELWRDLGKINTVDQGVGIDLQSDPKVVHLTNGNILYAWTSNADIGAGAAAGADVIGKIYDSLGNLVKDEFRLNFGFFSEDESDADIAALPGGGFAVVYIDNAGSDDTRVRLTEWNAAGTSSTDTTIATDTTDSDTFRNPSVEVSSDSSVLVTWEHVNPDLDADLTDVNVESAVYNAATNLVGSTALLFTGGEGTDEGVSGNAIAALSNGNYAVAYGNNNASNDEIEVKILDATGAQVGSTITVHNSSTYVQHAHVVALTGGRFIVAYETSAADPATNSVLRVKIYNNDGTLSAGPYLPATTSAGNQTNGVVAALTDGGFVVAWIDEDTQDIHGQRYATNGAKVGTEFDIDTNTGNSAISGLDIEGLDDGRFVVTWEEGNFTAVPLTLDYDVHSAIFDPRDEENSPAVYTDNQVIGTITRDIIFIDATDENVFGHDGNDDFRFRNGEAGPGDTFDGGAGTDALKLSGGGTLDFQNSTLLNFETVQFDGSSQTVILRADQVASGQLATNASIEGDFTAPLVTQTLRFVMGSDTNLDLSGFSFFDWENGVDSVEIIGDGSAETITGSSQNDTISGGGDVDTIDGGGGNDTLIVDAAGIIAGETYGGGADTDTLDFSASSADHIVNLQTDTFDLLAGGAASTATSIENVIAGSGNDDLTGRGDTATAILGGGGDDTIRLGPSLRTGSVFNGEGGTNTFNVSNSVDTLGYTVNLGTGAFSFVGGAQASMALNFTHVVGSTRDDTLIGNGLDNELTGGAGMDTIEGGAGADVLAGGTNGANGDTLSYAGSTVGVKVFLDTGLAAFGDAAGDVFSEFENLTGSSVRDIFRGDGGVNIIIGGDGDDAINGLGDDDMIFGGDGVDFLRGSAGNDTLDSGEGFGNVLHGGQGQDTLIGGSERDILRGDASADTLTGNGGNDVYFGGFNADRFVFNDNDGADVINDFEDNLVNEKIDLSGVAGVTQFSDLIISDIGASGDALINYGTGTIRVDSIAATAFDADDFIFV